MRGKVTVLLVVAASVGLGAAVWYIARPGPPIGPDGLRYDPIEDDPAVQPFLRAAEQEAREAPENQGERPKGWVHGFWRVKKRILKEKYGVDWQSPADMNPRVAFD